MAGDQGFQDSYVGVECLVPDGPCEVEVPGRVLRAPALGIAKAKRWIDLIARSEEGDGIAQVQLLEEVPAHFEGEDRRYVMEGLQVGEVFDLARRFLALRRAAPSPNPATTRTRATSDGTT